MKPNRNTEKDKIVKTIVIYGVAVGIVEKMSSDEFAYIYSNNDKVVEKTTDYLISEGFYYLDSYGKVIKNNF